MTSLAKPFMFHLPNHIRWRQSNCLLVGWDLRHAFQPPFFSAKQIASVQLFHMTGRSIDWLSKKINKIDVSVSVEVYFLKITWIMTWVGCSVVLRLNFESLMTDYVQVIMMFTCPTGCVNMTPIRRAMQDWKSQDNAGCSEIGYHLRVSKCKCGARYNGSFVGGRTRRQKPLIQLPAIGCTWIVREKVASETRLNARSRTG